MPSKSMHFCNRSGCNKLTNGRFCEEHMQEYDLKVAADSVKYNRYRGSANERGYDAEWRKVREGYLKQHPLCERCEKNGKVVPATLVHHKKALSEGGDRLNADNFMSLCNACHEEIESKGRWGRRASERKG